MKKYFIVLILMSLTACASGDRKIASTKDNQRSEAVIAPNLDAVMKKMIRAEVYDIMKMEVDTVEFTGTLNPIRNLKSAILEAMELVDGEVEYVSKNVFIRTTNVRKDEYGSDSHLKLNCSADFIMKKELASNKATLYNCVVYFEDLPWGHTRLTPNFNRLPTFN